MSNDTQPEIRFPGFTEAWEQRKLADLAEYYDGTHQTPKYTKSGVPFVSVENINNIKRTDKYISEEDFENQFKIKPQKDDILMTRITAGVIGDTTIVPDNNPLAYYVSLALIRPKKIMASYLEKYIGSNQFKEELHKRIIHTAFPKKINLGEIGQCIVSCPCNDSEQEKIGSFFKQLDKTITLHQRKLDLLKETKKGFLQKMFPKNGAKVPEIRFPGFTEDWEQCKLGEIVRISSGFTGDSSLNIGQYELTRIETIATGQVNLNKVGYSNTEPDKKYLLDKGDILFSNINSLSHIGKIALFDLDMKLYHGINLLRLQPMNVNSQFLYQSFQLNNHLEWAKSHANQAVSQASINQTELSKQVFLVPSQQEQQKIGTFFKQLDDTITLYQRELDLLKKTKKGFLQKMFV